MRTGQTGGAAVDGYFGTGFGPRPVGAVGSSRSHGRVSTSTQRNCTVSRHSRLRSNFNYLVYGIHLRSDIPLDLPEGSSDVCPTIQLTVGIPNHLENQPGEQLTEPNEWCRYLQRADGSFYALWEGLGQFVVSNCGTRIWAQPGPDVAMQSFQVYLLGQALSFALIRRGFEPIHGTAVERNGLAVAFLGKSGFGKSTLAASFLEDGFRLVTDDLLLLIPDGPVVRAQPGPPRIKLVPGPAADHFNSLINAVPMNAWSEKLVIPLSDVQHVESAVQLLAIYVLDPPEEAASDERITVTPIAGGQAFTALVANTFNARVTDPVRLRQQLLSNTAALRHLQVQRLRYPRRMECLADVRSTIIAESGLGNRRLS